MDLSVPRVVALTLLLGCTRTPAQCRALADIAAKCDYPKQVVAGLTEHCSPSLRYKTDDPVMTRFRALFEECAAAKTCDDLKACLERHDCSFIAENERDKVWSPSCRSVFP